MSFWDLESQRKAFTIGMAKRLIKFNGRCTEATIICSRKCPFCLCLTNPTANCDAPGALFMARQFMKLEQMRELLG